MDDAQELAAWTDVVPIGDLLLRSAARLPDRDAIVFPGERWTFGELYARASQVARGLIALGVQPGQHVGLLAQNCIEYVEGLFGISLSGGIVIPINARHKTSELGYIVDNGDLVALLTTAADASAHVDFVDLVSRALPSLRRATDPRELQLPEAPRLRHVIALCGEPALPGVLDRAALDTLAEQVTTTELHSARNKAKLRDAAMILYTSGTTANPKGCVLSHEAMVRGPLHRALHRYGTGDADVTWGAGPLYHVGCLSPFLGSIGAGGTYLTDLYFEPGRALSLMAQEQASVAFPWFPGIMQPLLDHPDFVPEALKSLRSILVIGPRPMIEQVQTTFPNAEMIAACGMTETAGIYALSDRGETVAERSEAQGKAAPGIELRIVDIVTGEDVQDGTMGEILVRGYCVMNEYYKDPEKTARALDADGWLHSGDLYTRTPDGRVIFDGRLKDMLKVGGENVATIEIESFLCSHPAVQMASVVGRTDLRLDEVPIAFVELKTGQSITAEELRDFCRGRISNYKIPAEVFFLTGTEWPMSTTKIDKRGLRARVTGLGE
ncbi:MAG TPA: AMP-binding protein [Kribbella sp.]|jgi:fatty-acyl-CoA synthase/long-chain acyl-CoA synthetase